MSDSTAPVARTLHAIGRLKKGFYMARITAEEKQVLHSNIHSLCSGAAIRVWEKIRADIKEARPTVRKAVQQRKACNNADKVQCLGCGEWFINIDGCPNGCLAGVTTAIA
jgi:hypothetical protein